jgi:t-SNARE complex subunit (syntaxin)
MNHEEKIVEIINRIKINRKIVKDIRESVLAECMASSKYVEAQTLFRENREKMREIEKQNMSLNDLTQLENAKLAIKDDQQLLSDVALNAYTKGESLTFRRDGAEYVANIKVGMQMKLL